MDDRRLTRLLGQLLERADFPGQGRIGSEELPDWPAGAHQLLVDLRLVSRASNERGLVCDECEEECWLEPTRTANVGGEDVLVDACPNGRDVGLLTFHPSRLVAWRLDLEGLAVAVGGRVGTTVGGTAGAAVGAAVGVSGQSWSNRITGGCRPPTGLPSPQAHPSTSPSLTW